MILIKNSEKYIVPNTTGGDNDLTAKKFSELKLFALVRF